jgi:hypothetical protein
MTIHRVVAFEDTKVKKVICLTCKGQHNYRKSPPKTKEQPPESGDGAEVKAPTEPKAPKAPRAPKAAKTPKETKGRAKKPQPVEPDPSNRAWQDLKEALGAGRLTPYSITGTYEAGQALDHAHFGVGFVIKVLQPNKIEVLFENAVKILIMMENEANVPKA